MILVVILETFPQLSDVERNLLVWTELNDLFVMFQSSQEYALTNNDLEILPLNYEYS